ncbi:MAG: CIA30 family protein [Verrucomicrobiales bacterium]|nr:CIA30 family protein [Verrucomicrobiales bacterium]
MLSVIPGSNASAEGKPGSWRGQSITEFTSDEVEKMDWRVVNDGVMGGRSKGKLDFTGNNTMKFSGVLSLENNGGFSTARSGDLDLNLSNELGLLLRVRGDGRTYEARLDSDARYRGRVVSFAGKFETVKGEWAQVKIPFISFEGSFRGLELPDKKLNPAAVERLWILLGDKKAGPFELEVDWVRTYGKGQGNYTESGTKQIIPTAVADGRFGTLKTALDTAGLTTFFQWDNALTVFAPTDEAFEKLPDGTLENLLKPENRKKLIAVLSSHVCPGDIRLSETTKSKQIKSVEGTPVRITFSDGKAQANEANIINADVLCSDGVIHVIDRVLLPPGLSL